MKAKQITVSLSIVSRASDRATYRLTGLKNTESVKVTGKIKAPSGRELSRKIEKRVGDILESAEVKELNTYRENTVTIR